MKELYRGSDRTKTEFVITTSTRDKEDRLHLKVVAWAKTEDYVFFCNDTYNHQTKWNVTKCKAVLKAIQNEKIRINKSTIKNIAKSKRPCCAICIQYQGGKEYAWNVPRKLVDKLQSGMWVRAKTKYRTITVKVLRIVPANELDFTPTQSIESITRKQDYELFTREQFITHVKQKKTV